MAPRGNVFFTEETPYGDEFCLHWKVFDGHIRLGKYGPSLPSVFEIRRSLTASEQIFPSKQDPARRLHVREVGQIGGKTWRTVTVAEIQGNEPGFVVTAYNTESLSFQNASPRIWPAEKE